MKLYVKFHIIITIMHTYVNEEEFQNCTSGAKLGEWVGGWVAGAKLGEWGGMGRWMGT